MITHLLTTLIFMLIAQGSATEVEEECYHLILKGKNVGELVAQREVEGPRVTYRNRSLTEAKLVATLRVELEQEAVLENGILQRAYSVTRVNGSEHQRTEIERTENGYQILRDGKKEQLRGPIHYCAIQLILDEPKGIHRSFSHQEAEFHRIERREAHAYRKVAGNGKENFYEYRNGKLWQAEIDAGWYRLKMKRKTP